MSNEPAPRRDHREITLADRLAAARAHTFVGREAELDFFIDLMANESPLAIWFITGAGGVGKSTLLRRLREIAVARGHAVVGLDARQVSPNPPAVRYALTQAFQSQRVLQRNARSRTRLLLIDTFECWEGLEPWLLEDVLPRLPVDVRLVIASRAEPSLDWRTDEGWRALTRVSRLEPFDATQCTEYLAGRGLDAQRQVGLYTLSRGHPLTLAMATDALLSGRALDAAAARTDGQLIDVLLETFTREAQDAEERRALDACAVARETNESLLAAMLGKSDVSRLYRWLRGLSSIESSERGVFPHDLVRETLMRDLPSRDPERYASLALAAFDWIVDRIEHAESLSWPEAARLATDGMYALRALTVVQHFLQPTGARSLYIDQRKPGDDPELDAMVARHEGPESLRWFAFWRRRHPDAIHVVRDAQGTPRGFFLKLDMEHISAEERDADPLTRRLGEALSGDNALLPGEHAPFIRFWVTTRYAQSQCPEKTQILMAINTYNLMASNLRLTAQVFGDSREWVQQAKALGIELLANSDTRIGGKVWRIYFNDWQRESPTRYYRRFAKRCIAFENTVTGSAAPGPSYQALAEHAFREAALDALKQLHRPAQLARNPLLASAMVITQTGHGAGEQTRSRILVEQIKAAADRLARAGGAGERWQQTLHRAYLSPARSQKAAADALHMGYSTFRRQLGEARQALVDELWQREKAAR